ncbi:Prolyl oligopeptidase family protein [hydrothermal vent metagenome]|uniref:Prolyl oligopeptidase family protein n=1 Tax=hydrothermal vent metagenome TaxID=652676 RepID=A0A3B0WJS2_9ZZZZ
MKKNSSTKQATYGNWVSAITSDLIIKDNVSIDEAKQVGDSLYYIERRPQEAGRCVIVKATQDKTIDITPAPYSVRSRVHEYGGGCYCTYKDWVFFINDRDQDIYLIKNNKISRITTIDNKRFAEFYYDEKFNRLISICETHNNGSVSNSIVSININNGDILEIEAGNDFYASPKLNNFSTQLCWQTWNHPNMPWDGNELWLADISDKGALTNKKHIAGNEKISVCQPQWSPKNILFFISDDTGWWHLYRYSNIEQKNTAQSNKGEQLTHGEKEFGLPQWIFAQSTYAFINDSDIICCYQTKGKTTLAKLLLSEKINLIDLQTDWQKFSAITADKNNIGFIASSNNTFPQLISARFDAEQKNLVTTVIKSSYSLPLSEKHYSAAQTVEFTNRKNQTVFANYYPPKNPNYQSNKNATPPLIIICHGGPTGQSSATLDAKKQFWTSRGFALLDVNYSGSTGYGRAYRSRLDGNWGILDVEDCCDAALYIVSQGLANKNQLIIRGSSAGGYTVLAALTFASVFSAGASYYGISELSSLAEDTHKFESRYLDRLIGPYPETSDLYQQRSPINHTEQLNCPVIFFQGIEDRVVPKQQAEKMFDALNKKGMSVAAQYFAGEQHGFRKATTTKQCLENELSFYQLIFDLKPESEISFEGNIQINNVQK